MIEHVRGSGAGYKCGTRWSDVLLGILRNSGELTLAEVTPTLLTLSEAAEACRKGKTVRCVDGAYAGWEYKISGRHFVCQCPNESTWELTGFPDFGAQQPGWLDLRFEVVE